MASFGYVSAALQLGVESILVKPKRSIGPFQAQVTLREQHTDELEITEQPVEAGSPITDHSFMKPCELVIECAWSNSPKNSNPISGLLGAATATIAGISSILTGNTLDQVRDVYLKLLALQKSRIAFDVYTAKRVYKDMLIKSIQTETDKESANVLRVTLHLRQIIIAQVQLVTISAPASAQADPASTMPSIQKGVKQLADGAKANLSSAIDALTPDPAKLLFGR